MVDLSVLQDLPTTKTSWVPPSPEMFRGPDLEVFSYDQSLKSTGLVILVRRDSVLSIKMAHTIRPPKHELKSFEQDFFEAAHLQECVEFDLGHHPSGDIPFVVVHETPMIVSSRTIKTSGPRAGVPGRMGGQAIRSAVKSQAPVLMVNAQQAKTLVCGNHKSDKKEAHGALARLVGPWLDLSAVTNEHQRDALLLALVIMKRNSDDQ